MNLLRIKVKQKLLRTCFCAGFVLWRILRITVLNCYVQNYSLKLCLRSCVYGIAEITSVSKATVIQQSSLWSMQAVFTGTLKTLYSCSTQPVHVLRSRKRRSRDIIILYCCFEKSICWQHAALWLYFITGCLILCHLAFISLVQKWIAKMASGIPEWGCFVWGIMRKSKAVLTPESLSLKDKSKKKQTTKQQTNQKNIVKGSQGRYVADLFPESCHVEFTFSLLLQI